MGWHWLICLYKFQVYNSVIHTLHITLCAPNLKFSLLLLPYIWPSLSSKVPPSLIPLPLRESLSCHALWGLRFLLGFFYLFYCQAHSNVFLILSACWLATDFYFLLIYCVLGKWITSLWEVCVCMCVCEQVLSGNLRDWVIMLLCVVFVTSILTAQKPYSFQSQHLGKTAIWKGKMKFKIRNCVLLCSFQTGQNNTFEKSLVRRLRTSTL